MRGGCLRQEEEGWSFREDGEIRRALGREESLGTGDIVVSWGGREETHGEVKGEVKGSWEV